ncbi:hypothetical protein CFC21_035029 [Triticum aestivum]|uniref:Uncharacterized protein n=3 Tax=Triticum TaxID=4564 RepID=A0A9R0RH99_TRITD|nr:uncharacterized protein LOC119267879 isoform X2 [Triticum dicoccoides]XP_048567874.1 uncharacterized protein LOC125548266 isoform X2 [Triticum urartu]KAF7022216.1 hypothetical protein CFC21_035029 [Triticum aestivum]VAH59885.1 unnamed protein product [Triticum turgidum subsp. durum]
MEANKPSYYLFVFVFAALLLSSMAGAQRKLLMSEDDAGSRMQEDDEVLVVVHGGRILRQVKTNDYGTYDPTPTMAKPHFKDIPN